MNPHRRRRPIAAILAAGLLAAAGVARAGETPAPENEQAAKRLAELQARLLDADLVVRARVANVLGVEDTAVLVLGIRETLRGASARKAVYVEMAKDDANGLDERDAVWFLKATADPRRFTLAEQDAILDAARADEIKAALATIEYAALDDLNFTVSLDKYTYKLDEPIRLTWTIENPTDKPIVIDVPTLRGDWGLRLGMLLRRLEGTEEYVIVNLRPYSKHGGDLEALGYTLHKAHGSAGGTASLLRLVSSHRAAEWAKEGSLLPPGTYSLKIVYDTSGLRTDAAMRARELGSSDVTADIRLGRLEAPTVHFVVSSEQLLDMEEAKAIVAQMAGVADFDKAMAQSLAGGTEPGLRPGTEFDWALQDFSSPALLPVYQKMLRSNDLLTSGVAAQAILMWARHPAVIKARPFEELLRDPPEGADMSSLARGAADVAEAQKDASMIPLLLKFLKDEGIGKVSRQSIALSIGAIAGLEIDPDDLDEAAAVIQNWVEKHPEEVAPPDTE